MFLRLLIDTFGAAGLLYGLLIPFLVLQLFALAFIPSMLVTGANGRKVGKALYCYLLQIIGLALLTLSGMTAVRSVLIGLALTPTMYLGLLIVFTIGGLTYLWHESAVESVEPASRAVPFALYYYTLKFVGYLIAIAAALWIIFTLLIGEQMDGLAWVNPGMFLFYGLLLSWCTRWPPDHSLNFEHNRMVRPPSSPVHPLHRNHGKKKK